MKMVYLISGRSAGSKNIGRKISEVTKTFNKYVTCSLICGGDIKGGNSFGGRSPSSAGNAEYYSRWYRKYSITAFFSRSYSELKDLIHCWHTYKLLKKDEGVPGLMWERSSRLHWAGILYAKRKSVPCVLEWKDHLVDYRHSLFHPLAIYIEKWKNKNADYIVVESNVLKEQLSSVGVNREKIIVSYNAVNPDEFERDQNARTTMRANLGILESDILVGYVGTYAFYHDSIRMLKAAKILRDKGVHSIKWLLIGDGKDKAVCEQFAQQYGLLQDGAVQMLPFQSKDLVPRFLAAMDVTILPGSTDIICPVKVMEYMATESVVLVPDYECNREIVNESNGRLFTPGREESIADTLLELSEDRDLCSRLGASARRTVLDRLTWDKTYGAALKQVLAGIQKDANCS